MPTKESIGALGVKGGWVDEVLRQETGFGTFDYSGYPNATSTVLFAEPEEYLRIQIGKMSSGITDGNPGSSIKVGINASPEVNAIAIPLGESALISLNAGMLVRLRQLFMFVACDEEIFPPQMEDHVIGDKSALRYGLEPSVVLEPADLSGRKLHLPDDGLIIPDDDYVHLYGPIPQTRSRVALATSLATAAMDFVAMHEFAHIARAHVRLMPHSISSFRETSDRISVSHVNSTAKPLSEVDADSRAKQLCEIDADLIGGHLSALKFSAGDTLFAAWRGWARSPLEALRLWTISVHLAFLLFDGWSSEIASEGSHPHPAPRIHTMIAGLLERWPNDVNIPDVFDFASETINTSRSLWARLGLPLDRMSPFFGDQKATLDASLQLISAYNAEFLPKVGNV